jgi:hypothetical protein
LVLEMIDESVHRGPPYAVLGFLGGQLGRVRPKQIVERLAATPDRTGSRASFRLAGTHAG